MISHSEGTAGEVRQIRSNAALCNASGMAILAITGKDSADYLHRMLSNSVKNLKPGDGCHATMLRGDGRMIGDLLVCSTGPLKYLLVAAPAARAGLMGQLSKYIIMEEVEIQDDSDSTPMLFLDGPRVPELLAKYSAPVGTMNVGGNCQCTIGTVMCCVIRSDSIGVPGVFLICESDSVGTVLDELAKQGIFPVSQVARDIVRVENGIPLYGEDMDESSIPLEVNLTQAVDFAKGCFPGQEIVARINNLGHPAKSLVGLRLSGQAGIGDELFIEDRGAGKISSLAASPTLGHIALGTVKWDFRAPGTTLTVQSDHGNFIAIVTSLPFEIP